MKIGVFTCWCGENIARTVDCEKVTEEVANIPGVHCAVTYKYMCSEPGQQLIHQKIKELGLTAVVVAACSPHMHLKTFRKAVETAGINPFLAEVANIREHCSWVHPNRNEATAKAIELIRMAVEKVKHNHALHMIEVPVTKRAMIIGGGVAGIQAALDIAVAGHEMQASSAMQWSDRKKSRKCSTANFRVSCSVEKNCYNLGKPISGKEQ